MHYLALVIQTIILLTALAKSSPVQQLTPLKLSDDCKPPIASSLIYMRWNFPSATDPQGSVARLRNMDQPSELAVTNKNCETLKTSMNQPEPKGNITVIMEGMTPGDLTIYGRTGRGKPLFVWNGKEEGGDNCGQTGDDMWAAWDCNFDYVVLKEFMK